MYISHHFSRMLGSFKPKYKKGGLPLPASFQRMQLQSKNWTWVGVVVFLVWLAYYTLGLVSLSKHNFRYPPAHPLTSPHTIESTSRYIYPPIEHAASLKQLGVHKLIKENRVRDANFPEIEQTIIKSLNVFDDPNPVAQKAKEDEENALLELAKAKNHFKNQDKVVYRPKPGAQYPEVVIVTAVDFEKYSLQGLRKIVQNRVDYAHHHNYGVYVRWYQEFLPILNSLSYLQIKEKAKWVRLYCMRAAMHAFPEAKWFWYLDQDGLIMEMNINLQQYLLDDDVLDPVMLRGQPIIPPSGAIKTYKNSKPSSVRLIVTQLDVKVETTSFIVRNDDIGKSILEFWGDRLYLNYASFPYGPDLGLTHILQWHPFVLLKTSITPARTINAKHPDTKSVNDKIHYKKGDLAVQWYECTPNNRCEEILDTYDGILNPKKE